MREYLSGLDGVTSVELDVNAGFMESNRWMVNVTLKDDPDLDSVLAIVRDTRNKVISLTDSGEVNLDVRWCQGATTMTCHLPLNDPEKAVLAAVLRFEDASRSVGAQLEVVPRAEGQSAPDHGDRQRHHQQ